MHLCLSNVFNPVGTPLVDDFLTLNFLFNGELLLEVPLKVVELQILGHVLLQPKLIYDLRGCEVGWGLAVVIYLS